MDYDSERERKFLICNKARIVTKGFMENSKTDMHDCDVPTCSFKGVRVLLSITKKMESENNWCQNGLLTWKRNKKKFTFNLQFGPE